MSYHATEKIRVDLEKEIPDIRTGESPGLVFGLAVSLFVQPVVGFALAFMINPVSGTFLRIGIPLLVVVASYLAGKAMDKDGFEPTRFQLFLGAVYWAYKHFKESDAEPEDKTSRVAAELVHRLLNSGPIKENDLFRSVTLYTEQQKKDALEVLISHKFVDRFPTGLQIARGKRESF
jgi:hypothetical protein